MIVSNRKLRVFVDFFGLPFSLYQSRKMKTKGMKTNLIDTLNGYPEWRSKSIAFKILKWYANL